MPIYAPGRRNRHNRSVKNGKRSVVVILSLTAMVDMFTVLVVFLLQNYRTTGEVININKEVTLPEAAAVKELKPAFVVVVSNQHIFLDKDIVASFVDVKEQESWIITNLFTRLQEGFKIKELERSQQGLTLKFKKAVTEVKGAEDDGSAEDDDRRITVQADKSVDFLTVKKVLFTLTEAGASQINFAVIKNEKVQVP